MGILEKVEQSMKSDRDKFMAYERVRKSGVVNMFMRREV